MQSAAETFYDIVKHNGRALIDIFYADEIPKKYPMYITRSSYYYYYGSKNGKRERDNARNEYSLTLSAEGWKRRRGTDGREFPRRPLLITAADAAAAAAATLHQPPGRSVWSTDQRAGARVRCGNYEITTTKVIKEIIKTPCVKRDKCRY